ncbi:MAG TPA: protein kinase, partial [Gemmataceae bacterium]|nr:protein kinase [Gemmataceae bacterium]
YQLVSELGRGALSRVFLARQTELCNREVVVKISVDLFNQSQVLPQLQHTNIVPIYSAHSAGPLQALCMPFFGRTTLAHVLKTLQADALPETGQYLVSQLRGTLPATPTGNVVSPAILPDPAADRLPLKRLEKLSYVHAMLWIAAQLAEGLAHAHERGVVHGDLKPTNILLGNDGLPMLLDFNLSEELRSPGEDSNLAGTLPYMSPEHLDAFQGGRQPVDARSDIFSLGVILYEMLTARLPYPMLSGPPAEIMPRLAVERASRAGKLRPWNRAVSPAVESMVLRCLAPDPSRRYQSARDLAEDINRHLENRPLRYVQEPSLKERLGKWLRRHPRVKSPVTLATLAIIALASFLIPTLWLGWQEDREKNRKDLAYRVRVEQRVAAIAAAEAGYREFQDLLPVAKRLEEFLILSQLHFDEDSSGGNLKDHITASKRVLELYKVTTNSFWQDLTLFYDLRPDEQQRLRPEVAELLYWLANAYCLDPSGKKPPDILAAAWDLNQRAEGCYVPAKLPPGFVLQKARLAAELGKKDARDILVRAQKMPLQTAWDYYTAAFELATFRKVDEAVGLLNKSLARDPNHFPAQLLLAVCRHNLARYSPQGRRLEETAAAYTTCIALKPSFVPAYFHRGQIHLSDPQQKSWEPARADADMVLRKRPDWVAARVLRARALFQEARARLGGKPGQAVPVAKESNKILNEAVQELTGALKFAADHGEIYFYRGKLYQALKDEGKAAADFARLSQIKPASAEGWSFRARARLAELDGPPAKSDKEKDALTKDALDDLEHALKIDAGHLPSLIAKARILAERQGQNQDALATLDRLVALYPDYSPALGQRGLLHARLGQHLKAYDDVIRLLDRHPDPAHHYQAAKIYALTSKSQAQDRQHALKQLSFALRNGHGWEHFQIDPDLESLRGEAEYQKLVQIAPILARPVPPRMRPPEKKTKP